MEDRVPINRALLSVSDKTGLEELGRALHEAGVELIASGGTGRALAEADLPVMTVPELTGSPEILGGRVKTLHPTIHGAILADTDIADHVDDLASQAIGPIDLVVCNLYPFEKTVAAGRPGQDALGSSIEKSWRR